MDITHEEQKNKWNQEHAEPFALKQMDSDQASSNLHAFYEFLKEQNLEKIRGVEMGCGKGRGVIWLAQQEKVEHMSGFDFSEVAISEAKERATKGGVSDKTDFVVADATEPWPYGDDSFNVAIDWTATTDIESTEGRNKAILEMFRVVKPEGYIMVYVMSSDDEYHKEMIEKSPAQEKDAFIHPETGKFEKIFSEEELGDLYHDFTLVEKRRINKVASFFGKEYKCYLHWRIYQKCNHKA